MKIDNEKILRTVCGRASQLLLTSIPLPSETPGITRVIA
jgi:hypothetical protein